MKFLENRFLSLLFRLVIGIVFLVAGIGKAADPSSFAHEILNYHIIPFPLINLFAMILPWVEILCGVFLIAGVRIKANAAISALFMLIFIIAIGSAMARGLNINCGCFAGYTVLVGWPKIMEDLGMLLLSLCLYFYPVQKYSLENYLLRTE